MKCRAIISALALFFRLQRQRAPLHGERIVLRRHQYVVQQKGGLFVFSHIRQPLS
jgi:hypothetical protein